VRGALGTVDRKYPWIVDEVQYHIGSTHIAHHLFPQIPHFHAQEATVAIKKALGKLYTKDDTPLLKAFYESCSIYFVYPEGDGAYHY
jgi:omega-6 fatty acid desaturase (delta-12 desaturase)